MKHTPISIAIIALLTILPASDSFACWGTRPLAMGGAFSGLADDANAIYWNPAGLALSKQPGITLMYNIGNENDSNYDQYIGMALPLGNYGTLGAALVYNEDFLYHSNGNKYGSRRDSHYQIGYGTYLKKQWGLSLGINFKAITKNKNSTTYTDQDEWFDLDIGVLWSFGKNVGVKKTFSLGFLLQNATEAQLLKTEETPKKIINLRPGISFHPDKKTTVSLELYDALKNTNNTNSNVSQNLRLGVERWFYAIVFRAGGYHINNKSLRAYTGGMGIKTPQNWGIDIKLDCTIIYWDKSNSSTKFIGLTYLF